LADKLVALFFEHGYDIKDQVTAFVGNINDCELPSGVDTVMSIGLLHNYLSLKDAKLLMEKWFSAGVCKVITDMYYDPKSVKTYDAELRIRFVKNVLRWKFGSPDGLLFCSHKTLCESLPNNMIEIWDHGLNATIVVLHEKVNNRIL